MNIFGRAIAIGFKLSGFNLLSIFILHEFKLRFKKRNTTQQVSFIDVMDIPSSDG